MRGRHPPHHREGRRNESIGKWEGGPPNRARCATQQVERIMKRNESDEKPDKILSAARRKSRKMGGRMLEEAGVLLSTRAGKRTFSKKHTCHDRKMDEGVRGGTPEKPISENG